MRFQRECLNFQFNSFVFGNVCRSKKNKANGASKIKAKEKKTLNVNENR